jgi:hypothetical protein
MMLNLKIKIIIIITCFSFYLKAQTNQYAFKREITGVTDIWHHLQIPNQVFKNVQSGLADVRIYGVKGKDTLEVPYILRQISDQIKEVNVSFQIINKSAAQGGYYYTFETKSVATINQIVLSLNQQNFDWHINLQGGNDNINWFTILTDYRILAIKNNDTDYSFTSLNFPDSKYKYFRIFIKSKEQPQLNSAKILKIDTVKGSNQDIVFSSYQLKNDIKNKQTIIDLKLNSLSPISHLKLNVQHNYDFYRDFRIEFATDSFKTDKGVQYNYSTLFNGTLSSLENTEFHFNNTLASHVKIIIDNNDNSPLQINSANLKGPIYELIARFEKPDYQYWLFYGNKNVIEPNYDLKNFTNKIPEGLKLISVGNEMKNPDYIIKTEKPLIENTYWLWALIIVIIGLLGFFTFRMMKS